jgi:hypothetical protein
MAKGLLNVDKLQRTMGCMLCFILTFASAKLDAASSGICEGAAVKAAAHTGVPLAILNAVALAETGRSATGGDDLSAWPWAVQSKNRGTWFDDQKSAISYVNALLAEGTRNFDVGCFQLNYHWHGANFSSLEEMINPDQNALYAAKYLDHLFGKAGDWRSAVGLYHSKNAERSDAYVRRLERIYAAYLATDPEPTAPAIDTKTQPKTKARFGLSVTRGAIIQSPTLRRPLIGGSP